MPRSVLDTIKNQAKTEGEMLSRRSRKYPLRMSNSSKEDNAKSMPISAFFNKVVRVSEQPVIPDLKTGFLPRDTRTTNGFFTITYNPEGSPKRVKGKPYTFGQDMVRGRFCVSGFKHLEALAKRIPEFAFILKWSNYSKGLFAIAKQHPGVPFPFNLNWAEYGEFIEKRAEQMGIDIDHKPFFVYITNAAKLRELREKYQMYSNPDREVYQTVLDEIDKEMNVYGRKSDDD